MAQLRIEPEINFYETSIFTTRPRGLIKTYSQNCRLTIKGGKKFILNGTPMILVSFFFSLRALSIGIGRDGIRLKLTEIAQTDKQTDTHSAFNVPVFGPLC